MFSEITKDRFRRFKKIKRAYYSLWILGAAFVLSLFSEAIANDRPIFIYFDETFYFPVLVDYPASVFGQSQARPDYVALRENQSFRARSVMMIPPIHHDPNHGYLDNREPPPHSPSWKHLLGTDRNGRDVFARLLYGFRICMSFSLALALLSALLGIVIGGIQGYLGSRTDIIMQRIIEVWQALPFLYVVLLIGAIYSRSFMMLLGVMAVFQWIGTSYYMRAEFLRLKNMTYIRVAQAQGLGHARIFFRHILPNAITPLITILPFSLVSGITALTALDFLGFGLPPPTPSWGELLSQGLQVIRQHPGLTVFTTIALFTTLLLATFIGEGAREAFDARAQVRVE